MKNTRKIVVGIDEAGRGPLIGPMVIALVALEARRVEELAKLGVRDSKEITPNRRASLKDIILSNSFITIYSIIPPSIIDQYNLNIIEYETIEYMLSRIFELIGSPPSEIVIDAIGPEIKLRSHLLKKLPWIKKTRLIIEPKADTKYTIVGAASIIAKVVRDSEIAMLRKLYGVRGSGYPTDPATLEWLTEAYQRNPRNPPWFIRRTWSTLKHIAPLWYIEKKNTTQGKKDSRQKTLFDYIYNE